MAQMDFDGMNTAQKDLDGFTQVSDNLVEFRRGRCKSSAQTLLALTLMGLLFIFVGGSFEITFYIGILFITLGLILTVIFTYTSFIAIDSFSRKVTVSSGWFGLQKTRIYPFDQFQGVKIDISVLSCGKKAEDLLSLNYRYYLEPLSGGKALVIGRTGYQLINCPLASTFAYTCRKARIVAKLLQCPLVVTTSNFYKLSEREYALVKRKAHFLTAYLRVPRQETKLQRIIFDPQQLRTVITPEEDATNYPKTELETDMEDIDGYLHKQEQTGNRICSPTLSFSGMFTQVTIRPERLCMVDFSNSPGFTLKKDVLLRNMDRDGCFFKVVGGFCFFIGLVCIFNVIFPQYGTSDQSSALRFGLAFSFIGAILLCYCSIQRFDLRTNTFTLGHGLIVPFIRRVHNLSRYQAVRITWNCGDNSGTVILNVMLEAYPGGKDEKVYSWNLGFLPYYDKFLRDAAYLAYQLKLPLIYPAMLDRELKRPLLPMHSSPASGVNEMKSD